MDLSWSKPQVITTTDAGAPSLAGHSLTHVNNKLYIFGGRTSFFSYSGSMYEYNLDTKTLKAVNATADATHGFPKARQSHTATLLNDGKTILIFAGNDGQTSLNDIWLFDTESKSWTFKSVSGTFQNNI